MSEHPDGPRASRPDVLGQLAEIVCLVTGHQVEQVRPDRTFVDDLRVDSLSMVEILEGASRHFDIRIEDEAAKYFVHVGDLVEHISVRLD